MGEKSDTRLWEQHSSTTARLLLPISHHPPPLRPMALPFAVPDARRIRSYFVRLPLATRLIFLLLTAFYIGRLIYPGLDEWGALIPNKINLNTRMPPSLHL